MNTMKQPGIGGGIMRLGSDHTSHDYARRGVLWRIKAEYATIAPAMARRPDPEPSDVLSEEEIKQLRHGLAHLSLDGVRQFYERAHEECRVMYGCLQSPRKIRFRPGVEAVVEVAKGVSFRGSLRVNESDSDVTQIITRGESQ
jgi:hypothetical protein